jgi:glycosyltransferase involved in cell wall biosynthesis
MTLGAEPAPALSVITPAFNSGPFIGETLESVAALTVPHEHLVVDGRSTDETLSILESQADPSLRWTSEADRGQTHAVNKGLERAGGELIGWLNADDTYIAGNVDRAVQALLADPELDAVFGYMEIVDVEGKPIREYRCGPFSWYRYLYFGEYVPTPTIIFRRSLLARAPRLDEQYVDAADYDFYLRLLRGAKVRNLRVPLVRFRYHAHSKTASDISLQVREAYDIRLRYARTPLHRWAMAGAFHAMRLRGRLVSPWPKTDE